MFKKYLSLPIPVYIGIFLAVVSAVWSMFNLSWIYILLVIFLWIIAIFLLIRYSFLLKYIWYIYVFLVCVVVVLNVFVSNTDSENTEEDSFAEYTADDTEYPEGTIYIEGESGTLANAGSYTFLGETAIGNEAYIGDGGASVSYTFNADSSGNYVFSVRLSDDDLHSDGARSVDILLDNSVSMRYEHISEDTKGWKWFEIGEVYLEQGQHTITFTKTESTTAAYTMDAFRFVPE